MSLKKLGADGIHQTGAFEVELGSEVDNIEFPCLPIGFVENVLLIDAKGRGITSLGKMTQLGFRSLRKVDTAMK
jgi:hypothetical protein